MQPEPLPSRELRQVAAGVLVATSRRMATNSIAITSGHEVLLIDPAWMPDELDGLAAELVSRRLEVIGGFATHAHHDHVLWHPGFGDAPRWASDTTARLAATERQTLVDALGSEFPPHLVDLMGRIRGAGAHVPDESVPAGIEIELIIHDGHAPGHTALWLPGEKVLVAGDMLSDIELPLPFYPDDLPSYAEALDLLAPVAAEASAVVPGHGNIGADPLARLDADRRYLDDMVQRGESDDPRIHNPGMGEEHAHMRQLVRAMTA